MTRPLGAIAGILSGLSVLVALHMARGIAPLFLVLTLTALLWHLLPRPQAPRALGAWTWPLAALCLWGMISAFWAFDPAGDGLGALRLSGLMLGGVLLASMVQGLGQDQARLFRRGFVLTYAAVALLIGFDEIAGGMPVMRLSYALRGMYPPANFGFDHDTKHRAVLLALLLPGAFMAARREWGMRAGAALAALSAVLILLHKSETSLLCLLAMALAAPLAYWRPRLLTWAGLLGLALLFAVPPFLHGNMPTAREIAREHPTLSRSLLARFIIWEYAAQRIAEKPLTGHGFDAAREIGGREPARHYDFDPFPDGSVYRPLMEPIPLHTHNGVIQLWLEQGAVGAALGALVLMLVWRGLLKQNGRDRQAAAAALFVAAMMPMLSSYGLFQNWWVGTVWIAIAALKASEPA